MSKDSGTVGKPFRITLLATGGTIEKYYDPVSGELALGQPVVEQLIDTLVLPDVAVRVERLMACDSLDMGPEERRRIVESVDVCCDGDADAVLVTHGTDTLAQTAAELQRGLGVPPVPVVLTGAMVPYRAAASDASQNVAQALMACRLLAAGVYAVFHGCVIAGHRIRKDYDRLTLVEAADSP